MHLTQSIEGRNSILTSGISLVGGQLPPTSGLVRSAVVTAHFTDNTTGEQQVRGKRVKGWA